MGYTQGHWPRLHHPSRFKGSFHKIRKLPSKIERIIARTRAFGLCLGDAARKENRLPFCEPAPGLWIWHGVRTVSNEDRPPLCEPAPGLWIWHGVCTVGNDRHGLLVMIHAEQRTCGYQSHCRNNKNGSTSVHDLLPPEMRVGSLGVERRGARSVRAQGRIGAPREESDCVLRFDWDYNHNRNSHKSWSSILAVAVEKR